MGDDRTDPGVRALWLPRRGHHPGGRTRGRPAGLADRTRGGPADGRGGRALPGESTHGTLEEPGGSGVTRVDRALPHRRLAWRAAEQSPRREGRQRAGRDRRCDRFRRDRLRAGDDGQGRVSAARAPVCRLGGGLRPDPAPRHSLAARESRLLHRRHRRAPQALHVRAGRPGARPSRPPGGAPRKPRGPRRRVARADGGRPDPLARTGGEEHPARGAVRLSVAALRLRLGVALADGWHEQITKRGWTSWRVPGVLHPAASWAWLVVLVAALLVWLATRAWLDAVDRGAYADRP